MRTLKLPIGKMNVLLTIVKVGYAEGVRRPKRIKKIIEPIVFNPPVLCIKLRKAA